MQPHHFELREYVDSAGHNHFREWLENLRDIKSRYVVDARLARIENGNFGDCKPVGECVMELRVHYGSGAGFILALKRAA